MILVHSIIHNDMGHSILKLHLNRVKRIAIAFQSCKNKEAYLQKLEYLGSLVDEAAVEFAIEDGAKIKQVFVRIIFG